MNNKCFGNRTIIVLLFLGFFLFLIGELTLISLLQSF